MMPGVQAWTEHPADGLEHTIRLWPHHLKGEGHYLAVLQKAGVLSRTCQGYCRNGVEKGINEKECRDFCICRGEIRRPAYRMPEGMPSIRNLKVLRPGLHLGTLKEPFRAVPCTGVSVKTGSGKACVQFRVTTHGQSILKWTDPEYGRRKGLVFSDCGWLQHWLGQVSRWHFKKSLPEGTSKKWLMGKQEKL